MDILEQFEVDNEEPYDSIEEHCAQYVTGYIANRFSEKFPQLIGTHGIDTMNWIKYYNMSKGSLKIPSNNLFRAVKILEKNFKEIHKENLNNEPNILKKLTNIVKPLISHLEIPAEVLQCIIRTRTYIRLNSLNRKIIDKQFKARDKKKKKKFTT
ncbi:uncharacterized protein LOC132918254 [Rhopalosiphum padi]|uniref:uncharacterized protein LOC132918254 n=1 Tax=Rhopalosiphum padi TaxID=40932 RepID=UPI00298D6BA4|nr:uncharacterized protein LOC132918254 [Rhopalosiphum padi]